jgi:hypothetical protein
MTNSQTNTKQLVFIDESGDPGITNNTKSHFVIAAVVIVDEREADLIRAKIIEYRRCLGWRDDHEFKFNKIEKKIAKNLIKLLSPYDFQIQAVIFDKNNSKTLRADDRYSLYNYVLVELLKQTKFSSAKICIDGKVGEKYRKKVITFLRQNLPKTQKIVSLRYADSRKINELQLADIVAGAIGRSLSDSKDAAVYIGLLKDKIVEIREL